MLAPIVSIILAATIVIVLAYPFVRKHRDEFSNSPDRSQLESADTLRYLLYREPVTLRNEYESGNITLAEYEEQLGDLRERAANMMRERAEQRTALISAELELEREVQRIRETRAAAQDDIRE